MKKSKKAILMAMATLCLSGSLSSCAIIFGGKVTEHQRRKPMPGEVQRQVRPVALIADILFWPALIVDFGTGAIYRPEPKALMVAPIKTSAVK
jgi:hypothetical protein